MPLTAADDGTIRPGPPFTGAANASFGVRGNGLVYLVDERGDGAITVLRGHEDGWACVAYTATRGAAPCHLDLDRGGTRLAAANYASGSVVLFALDPDGLPIEPPAVHHGSGRGPVADRQDGPHAHCVRFSPDGENLYWVDLGSDRVERLTLGPMRAGSAVLREAATVLLASPGSGPRGLLFHPHRPLALVLSELASTLILLHLAGGRLRTHQVVSTIPAGWRGENLGGHLELNAAGTRAYVSNRGHDSIAVFSLGGDRLEPIQHVPSGGAHPRHFALLEKERLLAVAHEKDGRVTLFAIASDGTLAPKGEGATVPGACFVLA